MESTEVGGDLVASLQDLLDRSDRLLGTASDGVQEGRDWCAELALQGEALQVGKKFPSFQALVESSKVLAKEQNVKHHIHRKPSFGRLQGGNYAVAVLRRAQVRPRLHCFLVAHCNILQYTATYCNILQYTAMCCNILQYEYMTKYCNTP